MNIHQTRTPHLVVLAVAPRMLRDMLHRVLDSTAGIIVVEAENELSLVRDVFSQVQIDWLIVNLTEDGRLSQQAHQLLHHIPSLSLVALSHDGSQLDVRLKSMEGKITRYHLRDLTLASFLSILCYKQGDALLPELFQRFLPATSIKEGEPEKAKENTGDSLRAVHRVWPRRTAPQIR